jgi:hypothetical protein
LKDRVVKQELLVCQERKANKVYKASLVILVLQVTKVIKGHLELLVPLDQKEKE